MSARKITDLSKEEAKEFFNSFDNIFLDCDGVIYSSVDMIPGADLVLNNLRKMGKTFRFVTNNTYLSPPLWAQKFKKYDMPLADLSELINPSVCMVDYLKRINFSKQLYVTGSMAEKNYLESCGFQIYCKDETQLPSPHTFDFVKEKDNKEVGAVIFQLDPDFNARRLWTSQLLLSNPDILFLVGAIEKDACIRPGVIVAGPKMFLDLLISATGRTPKLLGKPSNYLKNYILNDLQITNPKRTLFVGDQLEIDMVFAENCGFQKLLVLSGMSKMEDVDNCTEDFLPDYVADSLKDIATLLEKINY